MVTQEEADDMLSDALSTIDNYINELINKMVQARTKIIQSSERTLQMINNLLDSMPFSYKYRLGTVYDPIVRLEYDDLPTRDIQKPRMQLQYTGAKMSLTYDTDKTIEVPSVPQFYFTPPNVPQMITELTLDLLRRSIYFKFPSDAQIDEEPDVQNAYNKFYISTYSDSKIMSGEFTAELAGKVIPVIDVILSIDKFTYHSFDVLGRTLHSNGVEFKLYLGVYKGELEGTAQYPTGVSQPGVTLDSYLLIFTVIGYEEPVSCLFFNNELKKGPYDEATEQYRSYALWYQTHGNPLFVAIP